MIRCARPGDRPWIQATAGAVYAELGDYAHIIPTWFDHPGVMAFVDESHAGAAQRRGFILLGFYEPPGGPSGLSIADLLAIAVSPSFQRRGIGKALLRYAIRLAEHVGRDGSVSEIRLTVADGNAVGQHLYRSTGFHVLDEEHGLYDGGQRAIRMARPLCLQTVIARG